MTNTPLVSIIVSCYNSEKYIAETITSILNQTYKNIEVIVVDDGSTDGSKSIIQSFVDNRICYYYQKNKGQSAALNFGFTQSKGDLIKFYDSDDILYKESIEGQVASISGKDNCVSFIEWRRFYNNNTPESIANDKPHTIHKNCTPIEYITFTGTPPMYQCGIWLIPRSLILKAGLWNETLTLINDTEYFSRLLFHTKGLIFSEKGYTLYRTNAGEASMSSDFSSNGIKSALKATDLTVKYYHAIETSERIRNLIIESYLLLLDWAYPSQLVFARIIEKRIRLYGNEINVSRQSGRFFNLTTKVFGWRVAKTLSYYMRKCISYVN